MSDRNIPPLGDIFRENPLEPHHFRQQPPPFVPVPEVKPARNDRRWKHRVLLLALIVAVAAASFAAVGVLFSQRQSEEGGALTPEDAPVPEVTIGAPSHSSQAPTSPKKKAAPASRIEYFVTGSLTEQQDQPQVTITFINSKGKKQTLRQQPADGSGSFSWSTRMTSRADTEDRAGIRVVTDVPTTLTCRVTVDGNLTYEETAENVVNCGIK